MVYTKEQMGEMACGIAQHSESGQMVKQLLDRVAELERDNEGWEDECRLFQSLRDQAEARAWISCKEQMPKDGARVLAWFPNGGYCLWASVNEGEWRGIMGFYHLDLAEYDITHWQPINPPTD